VIRVAYPFRKLNDDLIKKLSDQHPCLSRSMINKTRPPKRPAVLDAALSEILTQSRVSAPAPNSYPIDERESFEAES
jgi:hypothetical protein